MIENIENSEKLVEESDKEYRDIQRLHKFKPKSFEQKKSKNFEERELLERYTAKL